MGKNPPRRMLQEETCYRRRPLQLQQVLQPQQLLEPKAPVGLDQPEHSGQVQPTTKAPRRKRSDHH